MPTARTRSPWSAGSVGRHGRRFGLVAAFWCATLLSGSAAEFLNDAAANDGVLILRNGEVLQGLVTPCENGYEVALPTGAVRVRARDVEFHCSTLHEGYELKHAAVPPERIAERLALAEWCLRHRLLLEARTQIDLARALDAEHPRLVLLERRLQLAQSPPRTRAVGEGAAAASVSLEDLDRLIRGLPPGSVEAYVNAVQPLLLNHCATAGCHNGSSNAQFRLLRPAAGKPASRRLTQRNLHAVWQLIDQQAPETSPLLTAPIRPHGSVETPIFTTARATQYQQIVAWVLHASGSAPPPGAADVSQSFSPLMQPRLRQGWRDVPPAAPRAPSAEDAIRNPPDDEAPPSAAEELSHRLLEGAAAQSEGGAEDDAAKPAAPDEQTPAAPRDEFDPEVFNRQFSPGK